MKKQKKHVGPLYDAMLAALKESGERLRAAEQAAEKAQMDFELACGQFIEPYLNKAQARRLLAPQNKQQGWQVTLEFGDFDPRQYREAFNESQGTWRNYVAHAQWVSGQGVPTTAYSGQGIELFLGMPKAMIRFPVGMGKAEVEAWLAARGVAQAARVSRTTTDLETQAKTLADQLRETRRQLRVLRKRAA